MHVRSALVALGLLLLSPVANAALAPRQSTSPCEWTCPAKDKANNHLVSSAPANGGTRFVCTYNGGGTCRYEKSNGNLQNDSDSGQCPAKAQGSASCTKKKRATVPVRKIREGEQLSKGKRVVMRRFQKRKTNTDAADKKPVPK